MDGKKCKPNDTKCTDTVKKCKPGDLDCIENDIKVKNVKQEKNNTTKKKN